MNKIAMVFGKRTAKSLFVLGNGFNLSQPITSENTKKIFEENDRLALSSDWKVVGEEVESALEQYGDVNKREAINTYTW